MTRPSNLAEDLVTADEFYQLIADGQKADLLDGVIYIASPDSRRSNKLTGFVFYLLEGFVAAKQLGGDVFVNRYAFRLTDIRAPEPDVAYVSAARLHLVDERWMRGGPDVAVEIVARDSRQRDYHEKWQAYLEAQVGEYWLIDPIGRRVEFLQLIDGRYEPIPLDANRIFRSTALPGFWLDIEWLLAPDLPNVYDCLQRIIAGSTT